MYQYPPRDTWIASHTLHDESMGFLIRGKAIRSVPVLRVLSLDKVGFHRLLFGMCYRKCAKVHIISPYGMVTFQEHYRREENGLR